MTFDQDEPLFPPAPEEEPPPNLPSIWPYLVGFLIVIGVAVLFNKVWLILLAMGLGLIGAYVVMNQVFQERLRVIQESMDRENQLREQLIALRLESEKRKREEEAVRRAPSPEEPGFDDDWEE